MTDSTKIDLASLVLRLGVGLPAMYYGAQHMLGLFGGAGLHTTVASMNTAFNIPPVFAILVIVAELFGGFGMVTGFFTSIASFSVACAMAVGSVLIFKSQPIVTELFGSHGPSVAADAFFTPSLFLGAIATMLLGGGAFSVDATVFKSKGKKKKSK